MKYKLHQLDHRNHSIRLVLMILVVGMLTSMDILDWRLSESGISCLKTCSLQCNTSEILNFLLRRFKYFWFFALYRYAYHLSTNMPLFSKMMKICCEKIRFQTTNNFIWWKSTQSVWFIPPPTRFIPPPHCFVGVGAEGAKKILGFWGLIWTISLVKSTILKCKSWNFSRLRRAFPETSISDVQSRKSYLKIPQNWPQILGPLGLFPPCFVGVWGSRKTRGE